MDIIKDIDQAHSCAEAVIGQPRDPTDLELTGVSNWFGNVLVNAVATGDRKAIRCLADKLLEIADLASDYDTPSPGWTLDSLSRHWTSVSEFLDGLLDADSNNWFTEDLVYVRSKSWRERSLLAFLNRLGDPIPLQSSAHAKRVAESGDISLPSSDTTYTRLSQLASRGLVQRAGIYPGLYELTSRGYRVARTLKFDSLDVDLPAGSLAVKCILSFISDNDEPQQLSISDILQRVILVGSLVDAAPNLRRCIELFLQHGIIKRVEGRQDAYELLPFGLCFARSIKQWQAADEDSNRRLDYTHNEIKTLPSVKIFIDDTGGSLELTARQLAEHFEPTETLTPLAQAYLFIDAQLDAGILKRKSPSENVYQITDAARLFWQSCRSN